MGSHSLLQGIFPPQRSNPGLPNCRWNLYHLSQQGSPPNVRVFSNESALHIWWPWYWSFSISPSSEYSGLIYLRTDWIDLLAVQGTLKSLPQHHTLKASTLWCSAFFMVQSSHPYMTARKTIAFTIWSFVSKVISLLLNMVCRFVIAFLPRSKCLLISWLQSPSAAILEPRKIQSVTLSSFHSSVYAIFVCLSLHCVVSTDP